MSSEFMQFSCTSCEYRGNSMVLWGRHSYISPDQGFVNMKRALGWCSSCEEITAIEVLPTEASLGQLRRDIEQTTAFVEAESSRLRAARHWFKKLLGLKPEPTRQLQDAEMKHLSLRRELMEAEQRAALLAGRVASARCLRCSTMDVVALPAAANRHASHSEPAQRIGFTHPGCGGELVTQLSGIRLSVQLNHRVFSLDGIEMKLPNSL